MDRGMDREDRWTREVGRRFEHACLDQLDADLRATIEEWSAKRSEGANLVLLGPVGTGKTHAAIAAVAEPYRRGAHVRFAPVVEMFDLLRPEGGEDVDAFAGAGILVLDDLGVEKVSEWTEERLYAIVSRRWREQRPTVVTSNLSAETLSEVMHERTWDRLLTTQTVRYWLGGESRRQQA